MSKSKSNNRVAMNTDVPKEASLGRDRAGLEKIRQSIPEDVRRENDELALILAEMAKPEKEPLAVRQKFSDYTRKSRERFTQLLSKEREKFNEGERKSRDIFLSKLNSDRVAFYRKKPTSAEIQEFAREQNQLRTEYFANERERRSEFEALTREKRANFDEYIKDKTGQFNEEIHRYTNEFNERRKALALKKQVQDKARAKGRTAGGAPESVPPVSPDENPYQGELENWNKIPPGPGTQLNTLDTQ